MICLLWKNEKWVFYQNQFFIGDLQWEVVRTFLILMMYCSFIEFLKDHVTLKIQLLFLFFLFHLAIFFWKKPTQFDTYFICIIKRPLKTNVKIQFLLVQENVIKPLAILRDVHVLNCFAKTKLLTKKVDLDKASWFHEYETSLPWLISVCKNTKNVFFSSATMDIIDTIKKHCDNVSGQKPITSGFRSNVEKSW